MPPPEPLSPEKKGDEEARGLIYEAYNELQRLAAELGGAAVPAPAVVVVSHQTDGKSALVEALMGFQFNHVGGGTKTRRPIALHLRFNPSCHSPNCRLLAGSGEGDAEDDAGAADRAMPLADIQAISLRELDDVTSLEDKLGRSLTREEKNRMGLSLLLKGMVVAPPDKFGETLINERVNGGTFTGSENFQLPNKMMPNAGMRLYGGAQYHRAMAEFRLVVGSIKCPPITREEIVNACGVEDIHDGTNYSRTACVIAVAKARDTFEPFLHQKDAEHFSSHDVLVKRVQAAFDKFAESTEQSCRERCMEDLESTTRYVTWSLHNKNRAGLRHFLDSFVAPEQYAHTAHSSGPHEQSSGLNDNKQDRPKGDLRSIHPSDSNPSSVASETRLIDLLDSTLWNRRLAPSSERLVYALVHQIFHGIKEHFLVTTELKFNCFLLMPIVDKLAALLREDLESAFEDDLDGIFNVTQLRHSLGQTKRELEVELKRIKRLKEKFGEINKKLNSLQVR
ncbi:hypothetical protein ACQ4PT_056045 [Festuca glaucescens]